jgi:phosphoserine phosphatase
LQVEGRLGSYSQIALWQALDKTPDEMSSAGLEVFGASPVDTPYEVVFPVDESSATSPAPLDFTVDPALFVAGAQPASGIVFGGSAMMEGTRRRPEIADLFAAMAREGIVPVIITASHTDLVRAVVDRHYGFAGHPVIGMSPVLSGGRYGAELTAPATYRHGKVDAARMAARLVTGDEDARPAFAAGDTTTDLEMLAYATSHRLFFDRKKRELLDLADFLAEHGMGDRTLVQAPL